MDVFSVTVNIVNATFWSFFSVYFIVGSLTHLLTAPSYLAYGPRLETYTREFPTQTVESVEAQVICKQRNNVQ